MPELFLNGRVSLHCGDCLEVLAGLEENSIDACVVDPPYHLTSIVKRFGAENAKPAMSAAQRRFQKTGGADRKPGTDQYARLSRGFMGKVWDGGDIAFQPETWAAVRRVLKPGGHLVAFGAPKNSHRLTCAIEDAGFEIRDMIAWLFGSGFPKSHDVSKGIDDHLFGVWLDDDPDRRAGYRADIAKAKAKGGTAEEIRKRVDIADDLWRARGGFLRAVVSEGAAVKRIIPGADQNKAGWAKEDGREYVPQVTAAATEEAAEFEGWGTALKPAIEPITLARKPLSEGTVAANVLRWRTGALNIAATRISGESTKRDNHGGGNPAQWRTGDRGDFTSGSDAGRWPANVAHDGSAEVVDALPSEVGGGSTTARNVGVLKHGGENSRPSHSDSLDDTVRTNHDGQGSAARFFYSAKADAEDRIGSKHPTVKPIDLVRWLVRMVTPPGGAVIDPFAGTGTLGEAAWLEGAQAVLIERESEYQADIRRRMKLCLAGPDEKARESIKAKTAGKPIDMGPLFGGEA